MCERENLSHNLLSLTMRPSLDVRSYSGCIVGGVWFHMIEHDSKRTTQNSGVMIVSENSDSGSTDNNFYGVLDEFISIQYLMGQRV